MTPKTNEKTISEQEKELLTFKIAQEAKKQVVSWAKWFAGVAITIIAILGFRAYTDLQSKIDSIDKQVADKVEDLFEQKQGRINQLSDQMIDHYIKSLVATETKSKQTLSDLTESSENIQTELTGLNNLINEYNLLIVKYKKEAEVSKEKFLKEISRETLSDDEGITIGSLVNDSSKIIYIIADISASGVKELSFDGKIHGAFTFNLVKHLKESNDIDIAYKSTKKVLKKEYSQNPYVIGSLEGLKLSGKKIKSLLVGIGKYDTDKIPDLRGPPNDIKIFSKYLKSLGSVNRILLDGTAKEGTIIENLNNLVNESKNNDIILFYFSGHITTQLNDINKRKETALVPSDGMKKIISLKKITGILSRSKAQKTVLIVD